MLNLKVNPYVWTKTSKDIKSSVLSVDLKKQDGARLNIADLSRPMELFIPDKNTSETIPNNTQGHLFVKPYNDSNSIRYHKIILENDFESALIEIRPENDTKFDVFISGGVKPTPNNYSFRTTIPDASLCAYFKSGIGYRNCSRNPFMLNVTGSIGVHYIGIRLALQANKTNTRITHQRTVRSCKDNHGRQKRSCIGVKDPPTTPPPTPHVIVPTYNALTDVTYTMSVKMKSCLYWSEKKQAWTNEGCKVCY